MRLNLGDSPPAAVVGPGDALWVSYTSGTTGQPKVGVLTHGRMAFVVTDPFGNLIPRTTEQARCIAVAPRRCCCGTRNSTRHGSGGSDVDPREVEGVLRTHPAVAEVAVLGGPDAKRVRSARPWCCVAKDHGTPAFRVALPKSACGKITKNDARRRLIERGKL